MNMDKNNTINKPITIARNEFIGNLLTLINESGLPAFVIEPILKDVYFEAQEAVKRQLEYDMTAYEKELMKHIEREEETEKTDE